MPESSAAAWTTDAGVMAAVAVRRVPSRYAPGGTPARAAALARNKSVRKSFKEVNAFRYSNFIDLLYFSSRKYVVKESRSCCCFLVQPRHVPGQALFSPASQRLSHPDHIL